ncbi:hypothetical protein CROQUDRAFT_616898 [Cronartium quercuum f. sp. fusiforme G11]|uniref:Uncharacterized protein n=1 Tax=Cronartium quercuum f. sp. fusiforme G11 TaxID=708437 RepID=A0A9P6NER1_9BASI|nr:hypothetical protein CROQUDRAFT_616898 [Cronartium quercuum f. sp. fusiforme G11]
MPTFSAFYNISSMSLFQQPNYTDLRVHRSSREASLLNRISILDRRTYEIIETNGQITDMAYSPFIVTIEFPAMNEENTRLRKALEMHSSCKGTQTCRVINHSLIGTSDSKSLDSDKDRVSTWVIIFEFDDESYESIPLFKTWSETYDSFIIRKWKLYRGWKNTSI